MKQNLLIDLIAGFLKATPKRLAITRNVLIVLAALVGAALYLNNNGIIALPEWLLSLLSPEGVIAALFTAFGLQAAKKDANEGK